MPTDLHPDTTTHVRPSTPPATRRAHGAHERALRLVMADRHDPLVTALGAELRSRFEVVDQLDVELSAGERLVTAATTFHPDRRQWAERFFKSNLGVRLRSRRAEALLRAAPASADIVFQTHALFEVADARTVMYIDCTHRQSMDQWPDWNPLRGRALREWLGRERRQYQQSAHVFAFSQETATSITEEYDVPAERVSVVGAGLNVGSLPQLTARPAGPPTVLFVGNDFVRKGGHQLLEAFALVRRRVPAARLQIVGTPAVTDAQPGVEVLGRIHDRARLAELYAQADVFCLPAHFDPFPGALLEAMAHALPSVVTDSCGIPEIVGHEGAALTVERGAVAQLADALTHLLLDPAAASRMGAVARRRVEQGFLWSHVVDRMTPGLRAAAERARAS